MKIVFATGNEGKMREIRAILGDLEMPVLSMKEAGITGKTEETGRTFEENARIKARAAAAELQDRDAIVLADDSGLEVDALHGAPGVYSARYLGEDTPYAVKNRMILERLADVPDEQRTARFVCVIAAVLPDGSSFTERGIFEGRIGREPRGENGFGYDPVFFLPDLSRSAAELPAEEKNEISHRGMALRAMRSRLEKIRIKEKK